MADIRHSIQISAPAERVYSLTAGARGFAQWWAADVTGVGDSVEVAFFKRATVYSLKRQLSEPPTRCEWLCETGEEWSGTRLVFRLDPAREGTLLRFDHSGWRSQTEYFVSCTTVWGELMFRLKSAAEGKPRGPLFLSGGLAY